MSTKISEVHNESIRDEMSYDDNAGSQLLPLAKWLAEQDGIDFNAKQRQGHTPLHKVNVTYFLIKQVH